MKFFILLNIDTFQLFTQMLITPVLSIVIAADHVLGNLSV